MTLDTTAAQFMLHTFSNHGKVTGQNVQLLTDLDLQVHVLPEMPDNSWHTVAAVWAH